jgi:hypothetical protein
MSATRHLRVEIKARDGFWGRAFHVEWEHRHPDRKLTDCGGLFLIEAAWLADLDEVAEQTFCRVVRAPDNPRRRRWMSSLISSGGEG